MPVWCDPDSNHWVRPSSTRRAQPPRYSGATAYGSASGEGTLYGVLNLREGGAIPVVGHVRLALGHQQRVAQAVGELGPPPRQVGAEGRAAPDAAAEPAPDEPVADDVAVVGDAVAGAVGEGPGARLDLAGADEEADEGPRDGRVGGVCMSTSKLMPLKSGPCSAKGMMRAWAPKPLDQLTTPEEGPVRTTCGGRAPATGTCAVTVAGEWSSPHASARGQFPMRKAYRLTSATPVGLIEPLIRRHDGPTPHVDREVLNAIFYLARSGCRWTCFPTTCRPTRERVLPQLARRRHLAAHHGRLRESVRVAAGRDLAEHGSHRQRDGQGDRGRRRAGLRRRQEAQWRETPHHRR